VKQFASYLEITNRPIQYWSTKSVTDTWAHGLTHRRSTIAVYVISYSITHFQQLPVLNILGKTCAQIPQFRFLSQLVTLVSRVEPHLPMLNKKMIWPFGSPMDSAMRWNTDNGTTISFEQ